ncbi:MAG: hypothetical protein KDD29_01315 [Flavobacteriales bacterium]|nr:hypothetical protein [Flavobacteriales bacterium]
MTPITQKEIIHISNELAELIPDVEQGIRLLGLQLSNFEHEHEDQFMGQLEFNFKY